MTDPGAASRSGGVPSGDHPPLPRLRLNSTEPLSEVWLDRLPRRLPAHAATHGQPASVSPECLLCACPECGAPMTIRLWLRLADCWQCGTSMELSALVQRAARPASQVAAQATPQIGRPMPAARAPAEPVARTAHPIHPPAVPTQRRPPAQPAVSRPAAPRPMTRPRPVPLPPQHRAAAVPIRRVAVRGWRDWLLDAPPWLLSLLFHLLLLTLLGLLEVQPRVPVRGIVLSMSVGTQIRPGGRVRLETSDQPQFDLPLPEQPPQNEAERQALQLADQDARQIRLDPTARDPYLPPLPEVRRSIGTDDVRHTFAVRDPRVRVDLVRREGGTTLTEAAVARGLRWMAEHQHDDGSWSLDRFPESADCTGRCDGRGQVVSDSAATSLCLLPFLGAGQTHRSGIYRTVVAKGLRWLIAAQTPDGDLRADSQGNTGMYAHGQGAIVLCEAYAMTGDYQLRAPAQAAIDFIVAAQHPAGGWRYHPGQDGDTSVLGWQLMALQSARAAGLDVPTATLVAAQHYLDSALTGDGVSYAYRPGEGPSHVMTAEALLCRMYLGASLHDQDVREGLQQMARQHPPRREEPNVYYWYYATQALHHAGGPTWDEWNRALRDVVVQLQETTGHAAGSWSPRGPHADAGGRLYTTALAVCTLEVYYRHAPIFRRIQL